MAQDRFLQILRNFSSADRAAAEQLLRTAANSTDLYHAGTPIVAFYGQSATPKGEQKTFAVRASGATYGTDVTKNYQALLGIMGANRNEIEIFDIESSVDALLGGATDGITLTNVANSQTSTWDFRSLGGIQVVIEAMDGFITTSLSDLGTRITNLTGQSGSTYVAATAASAQNPDGAHYINNATSLQNAAEKLDAALYAISQTVSGNAISNADQSITVTAGANDTDIHVNIRSNEHVLANDNTQDAGGLYTDIKIVKVKKEGTAGTNEVVDSSLDENVREAFRLYGTDNTQLGQQINIYKDSSLTDVFVGHVDDTFTNPISGQTKVTDSYTDKDTDVTDGTGDAALVFVYHKEDGNYELVAVESGAFLTESEFSDGLQVNNHVVSVKKDTTSGKVRTADTPSGVTPGDAGDTGLVDVLTVSSNGVKVDNIQAAINYAVTNATTDLAISAEGDDYITAAVDANNNKKINVSADVQDLTATAGTPGVYNASTGAQTTAPVAGTLSGVADSLGDAADIATKVKTYVDGAIAIEAARNDAKNVADIAALDGEALASTAPTAVSYSGTNSDEFQVLTRVNEVDGKVKAVDATANSDGSKSVTLKKVAATGAAADVSYSNTTSSLTATTVQAAIDEVEGRVDTLETTAGGALQSISAGNDAIAVGTEDSNHDQSVSLVLDGTTAAADNGSQTITGVSNALQITDDGLYLCNVWDCGEYTVTVNP